MTMTEDFIGKDGKLEEVFIAAADSKLQMVAFEPMEVRAARDKPYLLAGLRKMRQLMGEKQFELYLNNAENINISGNAMLILVGGEKARTILLGKWESDLKNAFGVESLRIVGGARSGLDAY